MHLGESTERQLGHLRLSDLQRIEAGAQRAPMSLGEFPRLGQRHVGCRTEPHVSPPAFQGIHAHTATAAAGEDAEVEAAAIGVPARRLDRFHLPWGESLRHPVHGGVVLACSLVAIAILREP